MFKKALFVVISREGGVAGERVIGEMVGPESASATRL
jgi:hypothetical protein